ncbi:MAG TPA: aspartyl protease family protein [Salinimicrobium sp.]|nr:aspartyl protease family protein [Salinimicrobium sp.]
MKNLAFFIFFLSIPTLAQDGFRIENNRAKFSLSFELVNDLIIVPVQLNGVELSFLLDTGVDKTILFSLKANDSMELHSTSSVFFRGLGTDKAVKALQSKGHQIQIGKAINNNTTVFIIFEHEMSLSTRMGVPIHGIIGYDFFKDFVVKVNYQTRKLKVYDPKKFEYRNCRGCDDLEIVFQKNKPFTKVAAQVNDSISKNLNLLIDSGSGDALWLFQGTDKQLQVPENAFPDFLGFSLSGSVHGFRSRIPSLKIGNFKFEEITASFPDTTYTEGINELHNRDGSLGSKVLKRFHMIIDYSHNKIRLKPNRAYKDAFEYDMSGIVLAHAGLAFVKEFEVFEIEVSIENDISKRKTHQPKFSLKPQYIIMEVRKNSPAEIAGLQKGDMLISINGRATYNFTLSKILKILSSEDGKKIKMKIKRNGIEQTISFKLERLL